MGQAGRRLAITEEAARGGPLWGGSPSGLWASMAFLVLLPPRKTLALLQKYHFQLLAYVWGEDGEWLRSWRGVSFSAAP